MKENLSKDHSPTNVDRINGLTAAQVQAAREQYGQNVFKEAAKEPLWVKIKRS